MADLKLLFSSGKDGIPTDKILKQNLKYGINFYRTHWYFQVDSKHNPFVPGGNVKSLWGGFNQKLFAKLKTDLGRLRNHGCKLILTIDSSPVRRDEFDKHLWHVDNGGACPGRNGVVEFYGMKHKNGKPTQGSIDGAKAFKALLSEIHNQTDYVLYKNLILCLNWEIFSGFNRGGKEWARDMTDYWKSIDSRPIVIGTPYVKNLIDLNRKNVGGLIEAYNTAKWKRKNNTSYWRLKKYAWHPVGDWKNDLMAYEIKPIELKQAQFDKGMEPVNAELTVTDFATALIKRLYITMPFEHMMRFTKHLSGPNFQLDKTCEYDFALYRKYVYDYLLLIKPILDKWPLNAWQKSKLKRVTRKYIERRLK
jgi:hypothetical protein